MDWSLVADPAVIDYAALRAALIADRFHNGRSVEQLARSFTNSRHVVFALRDADVIGTARALSDDVGNGYIVDVWTRSDLRRRGIGRAMIETLIRAMPGQHLYLQSDDAQGFYERLGFRPQPQGLSFVVEPYLGDKR